MFKHHLISTTAFAVLALAAAAPAVYAQETTSAIRGQIFSSDNKPLGGIAVTIVHTPSGTRNTTTTDSNGVFDARGLRVGGPFVVTLAAAGYQKNEIADIFTTVGDTYALDAQLYSDAETIVVTGTGTRSRDLIIGSQRAFNADDIAGIVSVRRDVRDIVRKDPLANFDSNGGITIGGANTRFNRFSVDGIQLQDNFGLNNSGLPSSRGIVSIEALNQLSVKAAPFDVSEGKFQGGSINVVLKSGGNDFKASAFGYYGEDSLASNKGKGRSFIVGAQEETTPGFSEFTFKNFGAFLSGPIIQDKLFFAASYEWLKETRPASTGTADEGFPNAVPGATRAVVDQVRNIYRTVYAPLANNYEIGDVVRSTPENDRKLSAKIDWNITDDHRLALTYIQHKNEIPVSAGGRLNSSPTFRPSGGTDGPTISLESNWYNLIEDTKAYTGQINSTWSDALSTEVRVNLRDYRRGQDSRLGLGLGEFEVCLSPTSTDALGSNASRQCPTTILFFGPDESRQSNAFDSKTLTGSFNAQLRAGAHTLKLLAEYQNNDINNLFLQRSSGRYYFDSIADLNARRANQVDYAFAYNGEINSVAAQWDYSVYTVALQDTIRYSDALTFIFGLRYDWYDAKTNIPTNVFFQSGNGTTLLNSVTTAAPANTVFRGYGINNGKTLTNIGILQPRFGFNWKVAEGVDLAGGVGLFGGGTPDVWVSNNYSNNGVVAGRTTIQRTATPGAFTDTANPGNSNLAAAGAAALNAPTGLVPSALQTYLGSTATRNASGDILSIAPVNSLDPNFKAPSNWKFNLAFKAKADLGFLGDAWRFNVNLLGTKVNQALIWRDLRIAPRAETVVNGVTNTTANPAPVVQLTPDGRQRFTPLIAGTTNSDIQLTNSSDGGSFTAAFGFSKDWEAGFSLSGSYARQRSRDNATGGAATADTGYQVIVSSINPDRPESARSNFEVTNSARLTFGYRKAFFGDNETRLELSGEYRSGAPFSYTFATGTTSGRSTIFGLTGANSRYGFFVPDFNLPVTAGTGGRPVVGTVEFANQATLDTLRQIVQSTELRNYQGQIAPRNIGTSPSFTKMDVRVSQQIPFVWGKFTAFVDIENFLNLINSKWNSYRSYPNGVVLTNASCVGVRTQSCGRYLYTGAPTQGVADTSTTLSQGQSLWQMRLGLRYDF